MKNKMELTVWRLIDGVLMANRIRFGSWKSGDKVTDKSKSFADISDAEIMGSILPLEIANRRS